MGEFHYLCPIMKVVLIVVGKTTDKHLIHLINEYAERIGHYLPFDLEVIHELKNTKSLTADQQKEREGELIQKQLREGDWVVLLDEAGRQFRSVEFASYIEKKHTQAARRLVFIIGGPYGFSSAIYALAKEKISLSQMTFSHQMVRLFFVEQLYRAMTILRGEPYHHE